MWNPYSTKCFDGASVELKQIYEQVKKKKRHGGHVHELVGSRQDGSTWSQPVTTLVRRNFCSSTTRHPLLFNHWILSLTSHALILSRENHVFIVRGYASDIINIFQISNSYEKCKMLKIDVCIQHKYSQIKMREHMVCQNFCTWIWTHTWGSLTHD